MSVISDYFDARVIKSKDPSACWLWKGPHNDKGYPKIWTNKFSASAHRYSYERFVGPLDNLQCCHRCDNKGCVNPEHLFAGTNTDNVRDCLNKGKLPQGKLSVEKANEIKKLLGQRIKPKKIAELFGITQAMVSAIKHRKAWL
jgi:hypothetical protein